ncbi:SMP-30/gluconolactonase/LRE family protein [Bdellovibrio svalbardensis]|uniref:SMP-30/gluconolactonase/LRE family protein n=1 Tax=Bdellovibrio svalbardensis TaxID=2972972 RepID=A0ABT6DKM6_9BACT|nr:SMP-30/gluconolactonase/LRE family protein [Bdellovibrio svalbardensis]MDG0817104.1 SMP-30/gluconolactonase/LRE family protein [Bdellovibrio svalbardensis]
MILNILFLALFTRADFYQSQAISEKGLFTKGIEGPAVDVNGNLYVVNFNKPGTIGILQPKQQPALWITLPEGSISSSIRFNATHEMLVADYRKHQILKIDLSSKKTSVFAKNSEMNQPNDFAIAKNGDLYLSDPSWSSKKPGRIWTLDQNKKFHSLATDLKAVNGIDLSPDETKLYFTESISGGLYVYDLKDQQLTNKKLLYQFKKDTVDGIRVDMAGTIYVARITEGRIDRISPAGKLLNSIQTKGKEPNNMAFGGPDGKTLYVTIRDLGNIESFTVPEAGREWKLQH